MRIDPEKLEQAMEGLKVSAIDMRLGQPHGYLLRVKRRALLGCEFKPEIIQELEMILDYEIRLEENAGDREKGG